MTPVDFAIERIWAAWAVSWLIAAVWSARTTARPPLGSGIVHRVPTVLGAAMLFSPFFAPREARQWFLAPDIGWAMAGVTAAGFLFAWWARIHLGRLWSGNVVKKADHRVVDSGPYALVRHPIYTGIIFSSFATAAAFGTPASLAGAVLMSFGWYVKARQEENFLRAELDAAAYDAYAARVPMLIPFVTVIKK